MRTIAGIVAELLGVLLAGVVSFLAAIGFAFGVLFMWVCGVVSGLFLIAALFSGMMLLFTHSPHAARTMLGFLGYATVPFLLIVMISYYYGKWTDLLDGNHQPRALNRPRRSSKGQFIPMP